MEEKFIRITIKNYYKTKTGTLSHLDSSTLRSNCETMRSYSCQTHGHGGIWSMITVPGSFGGRKRCQDPCSCWAFSPVGKGKLPCVMWAGLPFSQYAQTQPLQKHGNILVPLRKSSCSETPEFPCPNAPGFLRDSAGPPYNSAIKELIFVTARKLQEHSVVTRAVSIPTEPGKYFECHPWPQGWNAYKPKITNLY